MCAETGCDDPDQLVELLRRYSGESNGITPLDKAWIGTRSIRTRPSETTPPTPKRQPYKINQRLPSATVTQLIADYLTGASSREVAERYGIAKQSALRLLRDHQVARPRSRITEAQVDHAAALVEGGLSIATAAQRVGVPPTTMRRALKKRSSLREPPGTTRDP